MSFVPLILLLYLAIAALEDSGYMSRAAFVLDRLMHRIGLHGKSFIPMLIGFGCTAGGHGHANFGNAAGPPDDNPGAAADESAPPACRCTCCCSAHFFPPRGPERRAVA